jgi:hypothetical protein
VLRLEQFWFKCLYFQIEQEVHLSRKRERGQQFHPFVFERKNVSV